MKQIFDEDSANEAYMENKAEVRQYTSVMKAVSDTLHALHPHCNVEIKMKLALDGLTKEELERINNTVW